MSTVACGHCQREFGSQEALEMHAAAKHSGEGHVHSSPMSRQRLKRLVYGAIATVAVVVFVMLLLQGTHEGNAADVPEISLPRGPIHWHPHLRIIINGIEQNIPADIGGHKPIHTHEPGGILHMENERPTLHTLQLGNFFEVWGRNFSNDCIFDYCTTDGKLTMTVNGKENNEFEKYVMHDKDKIVVEYNAFNLSEGK